MTNHPKSSTKQAEEVHPPVGEGKAAERIWISKGRVYPMNPDNADLDSAPVEYRRVTTLPDLAQLAATSLPCAGYEGCRTLEGVMYDFFVHDPACPKSPEQIEQSKLRDHAQLSREIAEKWLRDEEAYRMLPDHTLESKITKLSNIIAQSLAEK